MEQPTWLWIASIPPGCAAPDHNHRQRHSRIVRLCRPVATLAVAFAYQAAAWAVLVTTAAHRSG